MMGWAVKSIIKSDEYSVSIVFLGLGNREITNVD